MDPVKRTMFTFYLGYRPEIFAPVGVCACEHCGSSKIIDSTPIGSETPTYFCATCHLEYEVGSGAIVMPSVGPVTGPTRRLELRCRECSEVLPSGAKFCIACGVETGL